MSLEDQGTQMTERRPDCNIRWFHKGEKYKWRSLENYPKIFTNQARRILNQNGGVD
jgi:hypothetical protein